MPLLALSAIPRSGVFASDVLLTAVAAWLLVCAFGISRRGLLEVSLAWWLSLAGLAGGAGVVLGEAGGLGPIGFLAVHAAVLLGLAIGRRRSLSSDFSALRRAAGSARRLLNAGSLESVATVCMLLVLAVFSALAACAQPSTADGLSYHLPRIGQWLQDGRVSLLATQDQRMNFISAVPDLVMAWLIGGSATGFRPAVLVQAIGGVMAFGATVGLARQTGLGRGAAVMAGALLFCMANVVVQFTASQTDLFATGIFAASFYLWLCALQRNMSSDLGGAGAGFALGAKGTLFYLAPGALVWVAFLAWRNPLPWARWRRTSIAFALGVVLFAVPGFVRNWKAYRNVFGPAEFVGLVHSGARSPVDFLHKIQWNLTCSLAQVFEPQSQPLGLRGVGRAVVAELERWVPERDPYTYFGLSRTETLKNNFLHRTEPDAEFTSFGIVAITLFAAGSLVAVARWRRRDGRLVAVWSAGVVVFIVFIHAMQQWHPYGFRYLVLAAPWIAVVSAWGIEQVHGRLRLAAWAIVLAAAANVSWRLTTHSYQSGLRAVVEPERSLTYFASMNWGEWSAQLEPGNAPLAIFMPEGSAIAGFYRRSPGRQISFGLAPGKPTLTAEDYTRSEPGWVIVPPTLFIGREGRVAASVWLYGGDTASRFSVAAYRRLQAGEKPRTVLYRDVLRDERDGLVRDLLVRTWDALPTRFLVSNPRTSELVYRLRTPTAEFKGAIPAEGNRVVELGLPADCVSEVKVIFDAPVGGGLPAPDPTLELMR